MNLVQLARSGRQPQAEQRYSLEEYIADVTSFMYAGQAYGSPVQQSWEQGAGGRKTERSDSPFEHWVQGAYKSNGIVFACQVARLMLFSQARFMWQRLENGRPGELYSTRVLKILEQPWVNGSTAELLARMIQDADLAGNAYIRRTSPLAEPRLERLRPDWVDIVLGSNSDLLNAEVIGYMYWSTGRGMGNPIALAREEVAHWSPIPDPIATYRGMSWLSPILREIRADGAATDHKLRFFENAATPNMVIKFDPSVTKDKLELFKAMMEDSHKGVANAYKNLYIGGGADATVVGADFKQMDFKVVQGAGETRIAAAAGVPPVIVGLSEGLQGSSLNAGNFSASRRRFGDLTIRPLWGSACSALSTLVRVPDRSQLWYLDDHIPALQEDEKDAADIEAVKATIISTLVQQGFEPGSVVEAVTSRDMSLLKHTGALSVQLIKPGELPATTNGKVPEGVTA